MMATVCSSMCSALCINWAHSGDGPCEKLPENFPFAWAKKALDQYLQLRQYYYGDFYPLYTGTAPDQRVLHRGLLKVAYRFARPLQIYSILIVENGGYLAQENEPRRGLAAVEGFQFTF